MTSIIAYGTVVRSPALIGLPLPGEERSVGFSVIVEEDFRDDDRADLKRGLYRVVLVGAQAVFALANLKVGSPVFLRGELFQHYPSFGDLAWNHRLVFGDEVILLAGELPSGRAYTIQMDSEEHPVRLYA
jgi:hypothetical protein